MQIGVVADNIGITPETVRYYEKVGLAEIARRGPKPGHEATHCHILESAL